jgi:hypothetical protein
MLNPDNGNLFPSRLLDQAGNVRENGVALVSPIDYAVLDIDDEQCSIRPVLECGHSASLPRALNGRGGMIPMLPGPSPVRHGSCGCLLFLRVLVGDNSGGEQKQHDPDA